MPSNIRRYQATNGAIPLTEQSFSGNERKGLELPVGGEARVRGIAAERPGPDAFGEEGGEGGIVLGDPLQGYLDSAGYVDSRALGSRCRPPISTAQPNRA
jgi:hypothetical protein